MRILLIEDSERLQRTISTGLRKEGYAVDVSGNGSEGLWRATGNVYDVIILDLMLPGLDGLSLLRQLRAHEGEAALAGVLILTAKDTVDDRVRGLRGGADDYLIKPFAFEELLARVDALVRRRHHAKRPEIIIADLTVDTTSRSATRAGRRIELSAREFALLQYLAIRVGAVVSRSDIEAHLYDDRSEIMSNVVDAAIYALRKKIDFPGSVQLIHTRRGMGYVLQPPEKSMNESPND